MGSETKSISQRTGQQPGPGGGANQRERRQLQRDGTRTRAFAEGADGTGMGPVVNAKQRARVLGYLEKGQAQGAEAVLAGGAAEVSGHDGFYVKPALLAGTLDFAILDAVSASPYIATNRLRALAINGTQRSPAFPAVPTLREAGVPFEAVGWHGVFAPAGTPQPALDRLNAAFNKAMALPRVRDAIIAGGSIGAMWMSSCVKPPCLARRPR